MTGGTAQVMMQYPIDLPGDYDMNVIVDRVRTRGSALDDRVGLICKAYCVREVGTDGSPVNQYAPFYLWGDAGAASDFLWGGTGFDGIIRDFGRPRIQTWLLSVVAFGSRPRSEITHALLRTEPISPGADLVEAADLLSARVRERSKDRQVHLALGGINPTTWEMVEFTTVKGPILFGADTPHVEGPGASVALFTVLHISQPETS